jgi:hypothetical protein
LTTLYLYAQQTVTTTLQVRIQAEAHVAPQRISLRFRVSPDGLSDVASQTESITAWVRALPGQRIRLEADVLALAGPNGPIAPAALRWSGSVLRASPGARGAACTAGTLDSGHRMDLISDWTLSGSMTCAVTFSVVSPRTLPPGPYMGTIDLVLRSE